MKYILLPIHPEWCCEFMNGDKETEVRRGTRLLKAINRLIEEQGKAPCLMYCTKASSKNPYLAKEWGESDHWDKCSLGGYGYSTSFAKEDFDEDSEILNGKVIAKFEASAEEIGIQFYGDEEYEGYKEIRYETSTAEQSELLGRSCLTYQQIRKYLGEYPKHEPIGTAIHVKPGTMKTDGFPKELKEFNKVGAPTYEQTKAILRGGYTMEQHKKYLARFGYALTKAPQSWCYVEVEE